MVCDEIYSTFSVRNDTKASIAVPLASRVSRLSAVSLVFRVSRLSRASRSFRPSRPPQSVTPCKAARSTVCRAKRTFLVVAVEHVLECEM